MSLDLLVVNFFPGFFPPASGGETRLFHLYRELSARHRVSLVTSTNFGARVEEVVHAPQLREFRFPKDELWRAAYASLERAGAGGDLSGLAFALATADPRCALRRAALELAESADIVIHEFPYSEPIFRERPPAVEIYNSHNAEAGLLASVVSGRGSDRAFSKLLRLERNLIGRAKRVFATSQEDGEIFRIFYGLEEARLAYCGNGYSEPELAPVRASRQARRPRPGSRPRLLFLGSQHAPNIEAALYLSELAKALPDCDMVVAGAVSAFVPAPVAPANLTLLGPFDAARKQALFESADLFLNPVVEGSGTSLKAIEALAAALPMVSTPEGARGLGLEPGKHALLCERTAFPEAIRSLLGDPARLSALAEAGAAFVRERFTWPAIADGLAADLEAVAAGKPATPAPAKPLAIAFNDFPVSPTISGGSARIRTVLGSLGVDVVLIAFGERSRVSLVEPGLVQVTIGKAEAHSGFETAINRNQAVSVNDIVASLYCAGNAVLADVLAELAPRCAFAVFEHCYLAPIIDLLDELASGLPLVYSAHNVEWRHKDELLREHPFHAPLVEYTRRIEAKLTDAAQLVVGCSEADAGYFAALGKDTVVVPNAADLPPRLAPRAGAKSAAPRIGFLGSGHPPNVEAAEFILETLAPAFPQAVFEFVGGVCAPLYGRRLPANVVLHGVVDGARKSEILFGWTIALNPVDKGGGSSLKLPDYLAHALPVVSTAVGARGFPLAEKRAGIVAERGEFAAHLRDLLENDRLRRELAARAQRFAKSDLGWQAAVAPYRAAIAKWHSRPPSAEAGRASLLVVTYRYTEPPLGGAESYLIEVVRRLRTRCRTIDLAAIDLGALVNRWHFASEYAPQEGGSARVLAECFDAVRLFAPDPPASRLIERCRRLERMWSNEERELYRPFAATLAAGGTPSLFAGFYPPEDHQGIMRRATAPAFSFLLPPGTRVVRITGWSPLRKHLRLSASPLSAAGPAAEAEYRQVVDGRFSLRVLLAPEAAAGLALLDCLADEHTAENDHRPLGVYIEEASVLVEAAGGGERNLLARPLVETTVELARDNDAILKTGHFPLWVDALTQRALARHAEDEAEFALVRGPHSRAMQAWLARHAAGYDAVLVQGIPFAVVPSTVETLCGLEKRPRIVTLPHFHADDRFYFWRHYLEAFARADANLLFSEAAAQRLARHGNFAVVPGGGASLEEQPRPSDIAEFGRLCPASGGFYLVLGRVTQSKGIDRVLRAHAELRERGAPFDLVVIGPYEDGPEPKGDGVRYLGAQPRGVVLAALSQCLGLVTMSESESFGIMICEAWKFKKPVIANAACHAFRELVRHGENGLIVAGEDELREAMARLAGDPELAARLGEAGFGLAASRFTWRHVADALAEVLFAPAAQAAEGEVGFGPGLDAVVDYVAG